LSHTHIHTHIHTHTHTYTTQAIPSMAAKILQNREGREDEYINDSRAKEWRGDFFVGG